MRSTVKENLEQRSEPSLIPQSYAIGFLVLAQWAVILWKWRWVVLKAALGGLELMLITSVLMRNDYASTV